ncbi:hypothetical protein Xen7305DRAFT_00015190 [Xenococcus sp. PCC 7305]|uniref:DUF58 domain-containing protein n=1 Tax=Xenococcus sp. PCC 7305 TaxID=102125 RepID=UPI0002ABD55B|nr:DUF58 domain-containing protein [Xenococcus sp. PCC 7305]ELS01813.1 hypothetical protein Xen7305DRAFT_00015190 [Xenococcus sp. PCC 7305]
MSYKTPYHLFRSLHRLKQWLNRRFTVLGKGIIICLLISAIVGIDTRLTMAYQVFAFLLAALAIAILFSLRFAARLVVTRTLPRFGTVGVKLQYSVLVENQTDKIQKGLSLKENFADSCPSYTEFSHAVSTNKYRFTSISYLYYRWRKLVNRRTKATTKVFDIPTIQAHGKTKVVMEIEPTARGIIELTGMTIARPDPFALFNACKTITLKQSLLILPKRYQVPRLELPGMRKAQSGSTSLAAAVGDSEEFVSLRDYRPGDPLRKIHWRSWAKTNKPIVREEREQFFVRHALILDNFDSNEYSEIMEETVSVAASFACDFQTQESLLDLMFVADQAYCFTAGRGLGTTEKMLEILAAVKTCQDTSFESLTTTVMNRVSLLSGCICILMRWDEARKKLIRNLQEFNIPTLVLVVTDQQESIDDFDLGKIHSLHLGKIQEGLMKLKIEN